MTDEQINAAITEAIDADPHWKCAKNYCKCLNAMHEAEKVLGNILMYDYASQISRRHDYGDLLTATARQRAEAFLRTLNKWEDAL